MHIRILAIICCLFICGFSTCDPQNPPTGLPANNTVNELATALSDLGVSPRDIIAIFQAIKEAGALNAKLIIN